MYLYKHTYQKKKCSKVIKKIVIKNMVAGGTRIDDKSMINKVTFKKHFKGRKINGEFWEGLLEFIG